MVMWSGLNAARLVGGLMAECREHDPSLDDEEVEMIVSTYEARRALIENREVDWNEAYRASHAPRLNGKSHLFA